jgi:hypothetical protein
MLATKHTFASVGHCDRDQVLQAIRAHQRAVV